MIHHPKAFSLAAACVLSSSVGPTAAEAAVAPVTVIHCGHLLDSLNGRMLGATTVVVDGGRFREVAATAATPTGAKEIDLTAQTCLPGLIDTHVHLTMEFNKASYSSVFRWNVADYAIRSTVFARKTLLAGFTTVRNLADVANESVALRNAINEGLIVGPRIFTAGQAIGSTGGHADPTNGFRTDLAGDPGPAVGIINGAEDGGQSGPPALQARRRRHQDHALGRRDGRRHER